MSDRGIVIDTSVCGEVRLALAELADVPRLHGIQVYRGSDLPTFTDALMRFARDTNIVLGDIPGAVAVAGAVSGNTIPIARSRWTISRDGLAVMFRQSPLILNEVAARAWAARAALPESIDLIRGAGRPELHKPGRFVLMMLDEGLGCAIIDITPDGRAHIIESEGGHTSFVASDMMAERIGAALKVGQTAAPSWEQALVLDVDGHATARTLGDTAVRRAQAGMLGDFVVQMILASAAWNGAILTGKGARQILAGEGRDLFNDAFMRPRSMRRLISTAPCWFVDQVEPVLMGMATMMNEHRRSAIPPT